MPVPPTARPIRARPAWAGRPGTRRVRVRRLRAIAAGVALSLVTAACGTSGSTDAPLVTALAPGKPPGTVSVSAGADVAQVAQQVQEAITASGGTVTTVVDHAANAREQGVEIPPSTVVVGGLPDRMLPALRLDQRAGATLPQRYLVRQTTAGTVDVTYDDADYIAAVSSIRAPEARDPLRSADAAVVERVAPGSGPQTPVPLINVTPADYVLTEFGSASVAATVDRLRRSADRGATRSVAAVDLAAGSPAVPEPLRPTSVVLVSTPALEAPMMVVAPSIGLDLPLRFLVWLDDQNRTQIGYPDVRRIAERHGLKADDPNVVQLAAAADRLAKLAAGIVE